MRILYIAACILLAAAIGLSAQTQRKALGSATFAIFVADDAGNPLNAVKVIVEGPAARQVTTERGRIAIENLPYGTYHLRFERDGFVSLERDVVAKSGVPIDVKVELKAVPPPVTKIEALPAPAPPPSPAPVKAEPVAVDIAAFVEKNFVGRASGKASPLACGSGGTATLLQVRDPLAEHTHRDADEFLYVVAGAGSAQIGGREQPLGASMFTLIPRGVPHTLVMKGKNPLIVLSIKAGESCTAH
jgi:mannose-6-phosphate isomerase-like protein (cupin superfamily)